MDRGFHFGFEGCGDGLVVLSLRREGIFFLSSSRFPHDLTKRILSRGVEGKEKGASRALRRLRTVSQNVGQNVEKENPCRTS